MGFDMQRRLGPGGLLVTCVFDVGRGVALIITSVILLGDYSISYQGKYMRRHLCGLPIALPIS
jgi:hypothetical protein